MRRERVREAHNRRGANRDGGSPARVDLEAEGPVQGVDDGEASRTRAAIVWLMAGMTRQQLEELAAVARRIAEEEETCRDE